MSERIATVLDRIKAQQQTPALPEGITALALLQMVYRGAVKVWAQQMRAAIESLPYENPKLSAVAVNYLSGDTFASRLDRAIDRRDSAKLMIEHRADPTDWSTLSFNDLSF
jgi:hypothetical protein